MTINTPSEPKIKSTEQKKRKPASQKQGPKIPKRITETYLHNAGLYYLQRYAASSGHFRTVMLRKVKRSCQHHTDQNYEDCAALVEALVEKFKSALLLDDDNYIKAMVASLRRKGISTKAILQKLQLKGVPREQTQKHLETHDHEYTSSDIAPDLKAAIIFARRKKLGPYNITEKKKHSPEEENKNLQKNLAKFGRNGFTFEIAKKILTMDEEEAQQILYQNHH